MFHFFSHYFHTAFAWVLDPYCWGLIALATMIQFLVPGCKPRLNPDYSIAWGYYPHVFTVSTCLAFLGFLSHW